MKVIIADDHPVFRVGMIYALKNYYGPETEILEGNDYGDVLKLVRDNPDVDFVFCDLEMPDCEPEQGLRSLIEEAGDTPVLVISGREDSEAMRMSLDAGAKGYLIKQTTMSILRPVLDLIASGEVYIPAKAVMDNISCGFGWARGRDNAPDWIARALSKRQFEILQALADGLSNKEIARKLDIVESTVKVQLKSIYRKINVRNRTEAALAMRFQRPAHEGAESVTSMVC